MLRIGLTGGVASGKSTAARSFERLGAAVFDADAIVAALYANGRAGCREVARLFGREFIVPGIGVDKARLAAEVFRNPHSRLRLEAAIHPLVVREIRKKFEAARKSGKSVAVAEASQIFEGGYEREFDLVVLVVAPIERRRQRWLSRRLEGRDFSRRAAAQIRPAVARQRASFVLANRGTPADLDREVGKLYARILQASPEPLPRSPRRSTPPSPRRRSSTATSRGGGASRRRGPRAR